MAVPQISPLPPAPQRTDAPAVFVPKADAFVAAQSTFQTEANTLATYVDAKAIEADEDATSASNSAISAASSAANAASTANAVAWVSGNTYAINTTAISQVDFKAYRKKTPSSVTTVDPANDGVNWIVTVEILKQLEVIRTSNIQLNETNIGSLIKYTAGGFTQTFATTMKSGWYIRLKNASTGDIGITTDGVTYFMYPGEVRDLNWDGTTLTSTVVKPFYKIYTTTATNNFTKPPGYSVFGGMAWSGGAGGSFAASGSLASGGGGGGCFPFQVFSNIVPATITITIGAGGTGSSSAEGASGGETSVGNLIFVSGGGNPQSGVLQNRNIFGGGVTFKTGAPPINTEGSSGAPGFGPFSAASQFSIGGLYGGLTTDINSAVNSQQATVFGGANGGSVTSGNTVIAGGGSIHGGAGGAAALSGTASNGTVPGGGGGGSRGTGGNGARGEVRIWGVV